MRIVLPLIHLDQIVFTPLPQLRLKGALVRAGVCAAEDVTILEYERDGSLQAMLDDMIALRPDIVGFSSYTWSFLAVERLSQAIKAQLPQTLVVWGGPHVSELPRLFFERYPASVDLIVTWYGEGAFPEIVKQWGWGAKADDIALFVPGVWSRNYGRQAETYPPLAELGYPYEYDWLPPTVTEHMGERVFLLETYRNCPFSCSYCLWGQAAKTLDAISAEQMLGYTHRLIGDGARIFMFADAGLGIVRNGDRSSRDKQVFRQYALDRLDRQGVQMRGYFFWQTLDEELCDILAELIGQGVMGQLDIGIQTFNPNVLHDLQRPTNYERFEKTMGLLRQRQIRFSLDLILGLPGDDLEGFKHSLRRVIATQPERTQSFPLSILPGTAYDLRRSELGIRTIRGSYRDDAETVIATDSFPYEEMQAALDVEAWMFLWYAEGLFVHTLYQLADERGVDPLTALDELRAWAHDHAPALSELVRIYRGKLYDSRSDGRRLLEQKLMDTFAAVYQELMAFCVHMGASKPIIDTLRSELLSFPKYKHVAESLHGIDGIVWDGNYLQCGTKGWNYQQDPVIGAIVRNRRFYRWLETDFARRQSHAFQSA